jgi:catechol 2,3-dioxygenase-like lactoylglutathione lyase family enzyme
MPSSRPVFNQVNLVVRDMRATVDFYERLGVVVQATDPDWERHHRNVESDDGLHFDLDSAAFAQQWNAGWSPDRTGAVLGFHFESADAVDETYAALTAAGHAGQQAPHDAFFGARYAVVTDPDGNAVGLMGPRDRSRSTTPPPPAD